ncbi:hypothetical protein HNR46_002426 [Haloferula luteola]|uniref:Uncharacterized protein n=1 Tax=Haloferula luteola TaxID=595692 RepID=A0A840V3T1_9BACT|nr:hypothetical protein [Haloferula luteola]MBB5352183.1 hypothetical protein [Haloferula luteola]
MSDRKPHRDVELRLVEEDSEESEEVLRLEGNKAVKVDSAPMPKLSPKVTRLEREGEGAARREKEPDVSVLLEDGRVEMDPEAEWKEAEGRKSAVPHGWFVAIFILLATAIGVSVFFLRRPAGEQETEIARHAAMEKIAEDKEADKEAAAFVAKIRQLVTDFVAADSADDWLPLIREPERVAPLVHDWVSRYPIQTPPMSFFGGVSPVMQRGKHVFWRVEYIDQQEVTRTLLVDADPDGQVKVDWETFVCYQPMEWEDFIEKRPENDGMDFRIYLEPDLGNLYAFEFQNEEEWSGYLLTTRDSSDYLIGYVKRGEPLDQFFRQMIVANQGMKVALVLRLRVPENAGSIRGVYIDRLVSDNWVISTDPS